MSKPIKVEDQIYEELDRLRGKGETFSQVVDKLLLVREEVLKTIVMFEKSAEYQKWKQEQLDKALETNRLPSAPAEVNSRQVNE